jgi:cytochrome P450
MPEIYEAPDRFRPHRWRTLEPRLFEFLPFSAGSHRCPGYWFAMQGLKVALAVILPRFRVNVVPGARIDRGYAAITLPGRGMPMQILPQDREFRLAPCGGTVFDLFTREERPCMN